MIETSTAMAAPLTAYLGFEQVPSLSPDGSQVAFSWNGPQQDNYDIYVKLVGPGEPVQCGADSPEQTSIDFVDFSTSRRKSLMRPGKQWFYGMALSPRKDSLLVSLVDSAGANLMVVDNFR